MAFSVTFDSAGDVPVSSSGYNAAGQSVDFTLNFAPAVGTQLTVVQNTNLDFIQGKFTNLQQGQRVILEFGGQPCVFAATYYGGTGNDLVLVWANNRLSMWGQTDGPPMTGMLERKTIVEAAGSMILCADGTLIGAPQPVSGANDRWPVAVASGGRSLVLFSDGTVTDFDQPIDLQNTFPGLVATAIGFSNQFALARGSDGRLVRWNYQDTSLPPVIVTNGVSFFSVENGHYVTWTPAGHIGGAMVTGGAWGDQNPTPIPTNPNGWPVSLICAGGGNSFVLFADGRVIAWGHPYQTPTVISGTGPLVGKTVVSLASAGDCWGLCSDGSVVRWSGGSTTGELIETALRPGERISRIFSGGLAIVSSPSEPEIAMESPSGRLSDSSPIPVGFDSTVAGSSSSILFAIRNVGTADLANLAVTKLGGGTPADFTIGPLGATTLAPDASTTFTVTFSPTAAGARTATLLIASNDADENPFEINLTGSQATALEAWRQSNFGSPYSTGPGADLNDADGDGIANLMEFATGSNPLAVTLPIGQLVKNGSTLEFTYTRPKAALTEVTYRLDWSESFSGVWSTVGGTTPVALTDDGVLQTVKHTVPAGSNGKRFVRLRVTRL